MKYQVVCDKKTAFGKAEPFVLKGVSPMITYPVTQNPIFDDRKDAEKFQQELEEWAAENNPINEKNHNENPNKFFPIQISSVDALLKRYKNLEKGILKSIAKTVETQKSLENLNKKIDDEMNNKILELKNCHIKLDKLQLNLSSKVAQYNYLLGTAKENVSDTQKIKENIKKANENIKNNNMVELSEKIKKFSNEEIGGENKDYIKDEENIIIAYFNDLEELNKNSRFKRYRKANNVADLVIPKKIEPNDVDMNDYEYYFLNNEIIYIRNKDDNSYVVFKIIEENKKIKKYDEPIKNDKIKII